jgi:hypothetical protein
MKALTMWAFALLPICTACVQPDNKIAIVKEFLAAREKKDKEAYMKLVSLDMRVWYEEKKGDGNPWSPEGAWSKWDEYFNAQKEYGVFKQDSNAVSVVVTETNDFYKLIERPASPILLTWWLNKENKIEGYLVKSMSDDNIKDKFNEFEAWAIKNDSTELKYLMPEGQINPKDDRPERWKNLLLKWRESIKSGQ